MKPFSLQNITLAHLELDGLRASVARYQRQYKYDEKISYYKSVLNRVRCQIERNQALFYSTDQLAIEIIPGWTVLVKAEDNAMLLRKQALLEKAITMAGLFKYSGDENDDLVFENLEGELTPFLDSYDLGLHWLSTAMPPRSFALVEEKIRTLHVRIGILLKRIYGRLHRDIRMSIRSIIRFLHISTDDEEDVENGFAFVFSKSFYYAINHQTWIRKLSLNN